MNKTPNPGSAAEFDPARVREIALRLKDLEGPLLPILHAVSDAFGYVDDRALPIIADMLNLTRAEVHGVVSFYHDFRRQAAGRRLVKICRAEACQSMGAMGLIASLEKALGVRLGETSSDREITLEAVYCLGNCALAPAAMIDGQLVGRLDAEKVMQRVRS